MTRVAGLGSLGALGTICALALGGAGCVRSLEPERVATIEVRPGPFLREVEARGVLKAVKATPILVPPEVDRVQTIAWIAKDGAPLSAGQVIVRFDPYDARREAADGQADLAAARARLGKAAAEGAKNERDLEIDRELAEGDLTRAERFHLTDETVYSRRDIIESRLDRELSAVKVKLADERLAESGRLSAAALSLGGIDADKARLRITIADKGLRALSIEAPHDGLLVLERSWRGETTFVGDTVWPGQKLAELPDLSELEARVLVLEADGAGLKPGLRLGSRSRAGPRTCTRRPSARSNRSPSRASGDRRSSTSRRPCPFARPTPRS